MVKAVILCRFVFPGSTTITSIWHVDYSTEHHSLTTAEPIPTPTAVEAIWAIMPGCLGWPTAEAGGAAAGTGDGRLAGRL